LEQILDCPNFVCTFVSIHGLVTSVNSTDDNKTMHNKGMLRKDKSNMILIFGKQTW